MITDDQGMGDLSCMGNKVVKTEEVVCASVNIIPSAATRSMCGVAILPRPGFRHCTSP
ncbi:hypothetical protein N8988_03050 [Opitutales bacterium]|nr:hypothetical protein [Opitutales bacterium]